MYRSYMRSHWILLALVFMAGLRASAAAATLTPVWTAAQFPGEAAVERAVVTLVSTERAKRRLPALAVDDALQTAARQHSREMGDQHYFDHASPEAAWRMPWQRAYRAGYWGQQVGENIALVENAAFSTPDAVAAHLLKLWMNSPTHRENLLGADWTLTGVGVAHLGNAYYATQLFAAPLARLERATLTPATRESIHVRLAGKVRAGQVTAFVDGRQVAAAMARGAYAVEFTMPRDQAAHTVTVCQGKQAVWQGALDGSKDSEKMLRATDVLRADSVTSAEAQVETLTGYVLAGAATVPARATCGLVCDGVVAAPLVADKERRTAFEVFLPARAALYRVGIAVGLQAEELIFVDTGKPLDAAFAGRPE